MASMRTARPCSRHLLLPSLTTLMTAKISLPSTRIVSMPYPGPRLAIPSPLYCSVLGVLIAKPLFRAMKSVGDGIVDASIRPAWKSGNENKYREKMPSNSIAGRTSFRRGPLTKETCGDGTRASARCSPESVRNTSSLRNLGCEGRRDGVKVVCRGAEMLSSSHFIKRSYLGVISLTTGICRPFPEVSSSFPKHWAMTLSREKPRHRRTPTSRY